MKKIKLKIKKLSKKQIIIISSILLIVILIIVLLSSKEPYVGKIKDGKAVYIDRIVNVTKSEDNIVIVFKNNEELIDNCIISNEIYDKFKSNDPLYNITIKDYSKLSNLSAKENYNINKSLQLKLVKEDDSYTDYYAMTCGFKNKKELMKYTKAVIKLSNKEK